MLHWSGSFCFCLCLPLGHSNLAKLQLTARPLTLLTRRRQRQMTVRSYRGSGVLQQRKDEGEWEKIRVIREKETRVTESVTDCWSTGASLNLRLLIECAVFSCHQSSVSTGKQEKQSTCCVSAPANGSAPLALQTAWTAHCVFSVNKCFLPLRSSTNTSA